MSRSKKIVTLKGETGECFGLPSSEDAFRTIWQALDALERTVPAKRIFRVVVFGSARVGKDHPAYDSTRTMCYEIAKHGPDIVTGGGPGLM